MKRVFMPIGKLKIFDTERGFGFIRQDDGSADLFVHVTSLFDHGVDPYELNKGDCLVYDIGRGRDGRAAATNVRRAE
jgi:cold shock protein